MPLPDTVQSKIMALLDAEQQTLSTTHMLQRQIHEAQHALGINPEGDKAGALGREIERLQRMQPDNQARHRAFADLNARVSNYLEALPAQSQIEATKPIKAKLKEGETHLKVVRRIRDEIVALITQRLTVERSSPTIKEMKASAARFVIALGDHGSPRPIIGRDKFDLQFGRGVIGETEPTPLQVLAWFNPMSVIARLEAMIDAMPTPTNMMTSPDRKKRLAEISDQMYELERNEQAHIQAAFEEGTMIDQRPNVDVRALLGFVVVTQDQAAA
jgi:hypothetical protein